MCSAGFHVSEAQKTDTNLFKMDVIRRYKLDTTLFLYKVDFDAIVVLLLIHILSYTSNNYCLLFINVLEIN